MRRRPMFLAAFVAAVASGRHGARDRAAQQADDDARQARSAARRRSRDTAGRRSRRTSTCPAGPGPHPLLGHPGQLGRVRRAVQRRVEAVHRRRLHRHRLRAARHRRVAGQIDLGGDPTQRDVSRMITWALNHEPVDPNKIAALGLSYGAGMSLLAAERDPRIKAVVAMSTWTNLMQAYFPNGTPEPARMQTLYGPTTVARLSPEGLQFHTAFARRELRRGRSGHHRDVAVAITDHQRRRAEPKPHRGDDRERLPGLVLSRRTAGDVLRQAHRAEASGAAVAAITAARNSPD